MKRILCLVFAAAISLASAFSLTQEQYDMFDNFIKHGKFIKLVYLDGQVEYRNGVAGHSSWWSIRLNDKKLEFPGTMGGDIKFDSWDMDGDAEGNLIFTEKEKPASTAKSSSKKR